MRIEGVERMLRTALCCAAMLASIKLVSAGDAAAQKAVGSRDNVAPYCDLTVPGNADINKLSGGECRIPVAQGNGLVLGMRPSVSLPLNRGKVAACTKIGSDIKKAFNLAHADFIATREFGSNFVFVSGCVDVNLFCDVTETARKHASTVELTLKCDRITPALAGPIAATLSAVTGENSAGVKKYFEKCLLQYQKNGKGLVDEEVGNALLGCDHETAVGRGRLDIRGELKAP
jgi:hypothetical protein